MTMPAPDARHPARVCVVETVYHTQPDAQPTSVEARFSRPLTTDEQPWVRKLKVGAEWESLETGWLDGASMLHLANDEGKFPQVIPTDEERAAAAAKVVEVCCVGAESTPWLVPPGETLRGVPPALDCLRVRCRAGSAKCTLTLFPE